MAKKKKGKDQNKELASVGFAPNEKPKTAQELEIERLLKKGREYGSKHKD